MVDREFNERARMRKIEEARKAEREAEERRQREAQREASRRKPHCSMSDDLGKRIIARAERRERILAEIRSGKPVASGQSATARWKTAIEAKLKAGVPRAQAILAADKENPGLRERMLREVNAQR